MVCPRGSSNLGRELYISSQAREFEVLSLSTLTRALYETLAWFSFWVHTNSQDILI